MSEDSTTVRQWTDILRRLRFGKRVAVGKTGVAGSTIKAVALAVATYADSDGSRVFPGLARIAVDLEIDYTTAKRAMAVLRDLGLLQLVRAGARRGRADEYRLALPADLLERLVVLSPSQYDLEVERIRSATRRTHPAGTGAPRTCTSPTVRVPHAPVPTVHNHPVRVPDAPVVHTAGPVGTGAAVLSKTVGTGAPHLQYGCATHLPPTTTDVTSTTDHPGEDVRTAVTVVRARGAVEDPISDVGGGELESGRCGHGLSTARRPDGRLACVACRVLEDRAAGRRPDPVPHRADDRARLATGDAVVLEFRPGSGLRRTARTA